MSKRFGRNQRRRLQSLVEVAQQLASDALYTMRESLERQKKMQRQFDENKRALAAVLGSPFHLADGEELWVIPEANVRRFVDTTTSERSDRMYEVDRSASVDLIEFSITDDLRNALSQRYRSRELVSFRGVRWTIVGLEANPRGDGMRTIHESRVGLQYTVHLQARANNIPFRSAKGSYIVVDEVDRYGG